MDIIDFYRAVATTIVGNLFTLAIVYALWKSSKLEQLGMKHHELPWGVLLMLIAPLGVVAFSVLTLD